jgi:hypothetical protein
MMGTQSVIEVEGRGARRRLRKRLMVGAAGVALALSASVGVAVVHPAAVSSQALSACTQWNDGAREMWNGKEFECTYMGAFSWEWVLVGRGGSGGHFIVQA